jgi:hypothetical protein
MTHEYELQRYAAYFRGWCQAFGKHDSVPCEVTGVNWLFSEYQVGFVLPSQLTRSLYREVLGKQGTPILELKATGAQIGSFQYPLCGAAYDQGIAAIQTVLEQGRDSCLFVTSHFMYGTGTRIITLASKKPLTIIYKDIGPMRIRLD